MVRDIGSHAVDTRTAHVCCGVLRTLASQSYLHSLAATLYNTAMNGTAYVIVHRSFNFFEPGRVSFGLVIVRSHK